MVRREPQMISTSSSLQRAISFVHFSVSLIAKLEWHKMGESARQLEDAAGVIRRQGVALDQEYVSRWVEELDLAEQWRQALALLAQAG
jgi:hypothetical protein